MDKPTTDAWHPPPPRANLLLRALPDCDFDRVEGRLQPVELIPGQRLIPDREAGPGHHFLFVVQGIVSLMYTTVAGESAESAVIGYEGGVSVGAAIVGHALPGDRVVQLPGFAWAIEARVLKEEFRRGGALQDALLCFNQALLTQMSQTVVCTRHHSIEQQLARWFLLRADRLAVPDVAMTQESIANALGVRRAGVTEAAGRLQGQGVLELARGHVHVRDHEALRGHACECYDVIRTEYERLLAGFSSDPARA